MAWHFSTDKYWQMSWQNPFTLAFKLAQIASAVMAEWLRRWTRNPMGSPRAGSNPARSEWFCIYKLKGCVYIIDFFTTLNVNYRDAAHRKDTYFLNQCNRRQSSNHTLAQLPPVIAQLVERETVDVKLLTDISRSAVRLRLAGML